MADPTQPIPVSKILESPAFTDEPLDEKFKILDDVRSNNLTHMGEQFSGAAEGFTPDRYAARVERQNWVVRNAKNSLVQQELQGKLQDWAVDNDSSPDAARDALLRHQAGQQDDIPDSLNQILNWSRDKQKQIQDSSSKAGFSGFNNIGLETDQGTSFGEGRIFQGADGKTQAAVSFYTDTNGQPSKDKQSQMVKLPDTYETTLTELEKRKHELSSNLSNQALYEDIGERRSFDEAKESFNKWEVELKQVDDKLQRYTDGIRGRSEFFKDKLDEQIRADDTLRSRIPQGSNMIVRPLADSLLSLVQGQRYTAAGATALYGAATGDKSMMEHARAFAKDAEEMGQVREFYGMGQTRHTPGIMASTAVLISEEAPQMAVDIMTGAAASLLSRGGVKMAAGAVYRNAFADQIADVGLRAIATEAKSTLIDNATRRWGAKVGAAIATMPSAAQDAASNLTNIYDHVDTLFADASRLEQSGRKEEASEKRKQAIEAEGEAGKAFMMHFGSTAALEFLPLERILRRNEKALDITENVFASAERSAKGVAAEQSLQAGADRAAAFRSTVQKWADSRFGKRTVEAMKGGSMEAITEVLQAMSDNRIAKEFYDENRGLFEGVPEAAWGGLVLGGLVNWMGTRTNRAGIERVMKQEVANQDQADKMVTENLSAVKGTDVGGVVAEAPKNVVQKIGATYRVIDQDMPDDTGFQNVEFKSPQEAEAFAEHRWKAYTTNQINNVLTQTQKEDGSPYTKQEIDDQLTVASTLVDSVADRNNMSRETLWKSLADSVTFSSADPALSAQDVPEADVLNALGTIQNSFNENPSDPEAAKWGDQIQQAQDDLQAWMQLPEDQRGPRPKMTADLALAVKHVHDMNKTASATPEGQELDQPGKTAPMNYAMPAQAVRPDLKDKYPNGTSTFDLIESGERTATTRAPFAKVGDVVTFDNGQGKKSKKYKVTAVEKPDFSTPEGVKKWADREGWDPEYILNNPKLRAQVTSPRSVQTVFEPVESSNESPASPVEQATPFEVWKSSVRRRFAPDAEPSEVEVAEIQRLQEVFGQDAPVNDDGTLDVIGALEQLSEQEGPMGELAGLLSDILPTLNLSNQSLRYRMSDELGADGITSPAMEGDMMVGQSDKTTRVGQNTGVVEFLHHMVTDTVGVLLDNYTASVGSAIAQRAPMQAIRPAGTMTTNWRPGALAAENTPAGIEARVAYETAMPFAMVQRNDEGAVSSSQSGVTMKQMFVNNELADILGGRPHKELVQAVATGNYAFGVNRPTQQTQKNFYLQTVADGRVVAWAGGAGRWKKMSFQQDDKSWKKYKFDTGWESRLARLYVREVITSGLYDNIFNPESGVAGTKMSRSEYLAQYGPDAPNYHLTSFSRFVQGVIMDPVFAMRVSKARYGFPAINVKDMVFGDVVNNALGARTLEPDPIKRFALSRSLSLGQQVEASKIPANSPAYGPQMYDEEKGKVIGSTKSPQEVGTARAAAQNYALSYQGTRQDVTGESPLGTGEGRTPDQIDPSEMAIRTPAELAYSPSGRFIGEGAEFTEDEGRAMYSDVAAKPRLAGEDLGVLSESEDITQDEIEQLNESLDSDATEYYENAFDAMAEKAVEEDTNELPSQSHIVADAINKMDMEVSAETAVPENTMGAIQAMVDNPSVTLPQFNALLAELEGQVSDNVLKELAQMWAEARVPAAEAMLKDDPEYKNASQKTKGEMYRAAIGAVLPTGMTKAQSSRLGSEPIPDGDAGLSGLRRELAPKRDVLVEKVKGFSKLQSKQVEKLVGAPIKGVPSNQVLAVTGEDPVNILLEHVRGLDPVRLGAAHDIMIQLSEEFGFQLSDELENSLGQIRINPQDGASWLAAERVLSAIRASKNPVAIVESMPGMMELRGVLWGLAQNPQLLQDAHALATSFTDSVALKFGEMGFQVKTKETEEGDEAPKDEPAGPGEEAESGQIGEDESGFVVMEGPRPGPSNEFINRASRYNIANKGGNATRIFPVGVRPFVSVNGKRLAISDQTRWSKLDNKSVSQVYEELAAQLGEEADTTALDKLYRSVWQRALSGEKGLSALAAIKNMVMEHRLENGTDLPLVSPEASEARTTSPAQAIASLLNTELAQKDPDDGATRRGFINTTTKLITILKNGDPTTFIHELTHWLRLTKNGDGMSMFDVALGRNREAFNQWATMDGKLDPVKDFRLVEERIALGMEAYLGENRKKPYLAGANKAVQSAFKRLAQTFRDIYQNLVKLVDMDARSRKGFDAVFSGGGAQVPLSRNPNLSVTETEAKRKKLVGEVTSKYSEMYYRSQQRQVEPFDEWKPAFDEEIMLRGERMGRFVRYLENEGLINSEEASLLRWVPTGLPGMANNEEVNEMMRAAAAAGLNAPTKEEIVDALAQEAKAPRNLVPRTVTDDATQYPGDPVTVLYATVPTHLNPQRVSILRSAIRLGAKKFNRWWRAQGNAPWSAFNILLERNGLKATIERDMVKIMKMAEEAIEKHAKGVGFSQSQDARADVHRDLNAYLIEQDPILKHQLYINLPSTDIKKAALRMRQYVDGLSIFLTARGIVRGPLASAINSKVGFYLHRSYQINSDPNWKHNLENGALKGVWERAIDVIQTTRQVSRDEAYNVGHEILSSTGFANKPDSGGINVDATVLMAVNKQFADIQQAADMILGLKEDPVNNFVKTIEGMASLISQHEFLSGVLKDGMAKGYIRDKNDPLNAQNRHLTEAFFGDTSPVDPNLWTSNPALAHQKTVLAGKYTTPEMAQWMTDVMQAEPVKTAIHRTINTVNAVFKTSNTVHNWVSGMRNVFSATIGVWGQGHTGRYLGTATALTVRDSKSAPLTAADEALMRELLEHNIAESATMAEIRDYSKRGFNLEAATMSALKANAVYGTVGYAPHSNQADKNWREGWHRFAKGFLKYDSFRKKVYSGTDVVAKVAAYLEEKDRVQSMFPQMTPKEVRAEAARRTHMTMFSFDMLPKAVNSFRTGFAGILWGPFVSFPYSMARVYANTMAIGYSDMSTGYKRGGVTDPQFLDGSKRLAALTAASWGARMATAAVNNALGWDDEDEVAARKMMAPWDREGNILFLTPRGGEFSYINLSSILPYNYVTDAITALVSGTASKDNKSLTDPLVAMMSQIVKPFIGEQFFLDAIGNAAKNTMNNGQPIVVEGDSLGRNVARVTSTFFAPLLAGDVRNLVRLGINPGEIGKYIGVKPNNDMDAWAKSAYALGFKVSTINVEKQFPWQVRDWIRQYKVSTADFYAQANNREPVSQEDLRRSVDFAMERHRNITKSASMQMNALMTKFGLSEDAIIDAFDKTTLMDGTVNFGKLNGLQKQAIWDGEWVDPISISEQQFYNIENSSEDAQQPERMVWFDDLMNEGLIDVQSGR